MPLNLIKKEIETEREVGYKYLQVLARAETLVPGAGREAIEALLWDANAAVIRVDVQSDRVVLDGMLNCQAVYRQGEETALRALSAKSNISQVTEIPGAQSGMLCRVLPIVENVEVRYENGHMVFLVSLGFHVRVMKLETVEFIEGVEGVEGAQLHFEEIQLTKLAAEATETAVLTDRVELPQALDARATLMDWGSVCVDSTEADLGGVRVKGRVQVETLIASGIEGRPAVLVKYPIEFDKLIELPEWLSKCVCVVPTVRSIRTQLEPPEDDEDGTLMIQVDVHFSITANLTEEVRALADAYTTTGAELQLQYKAVDFCEQAVCFHTGETIRGTVLLQEGSASVGNVIAVRVQPNIAEIVPTEMGSRISGILDATILYMPSGSDRAVSANTQMPFEMQLPQYVGEEAAVRLNVASAEANALMSDRLEMKIALCADCETRIQKSAEVVSDLQEGEVRQRKSGYIICWPEEGETAWSIGRRYGIAADVVSESTAEQKIVPGQPLVLRV